MSESEFWTALEFRVCDELECLRTDELRGWWCDGFIAEIFDDDRGRILGKVWMGKGIKGNSTSQEPWRFELLTGFRGIAREDIDWQLLLPSIDETAWLGIDAHRKSIIIEPSAARPDRSV